MTSLLDIFTVGIDSKGLKEFDKTLKKTRQNLDKAEKDVAGLEDELENLKKAGVEESDTFKKLSKELEKARNRVKKFSNEIKVMEGKSEFQLNKLRANMTKIIKTLGTMAIVGATVKRALDSYEQAEQIANLAQKADIAVESLQRLGNAASRFGGNTETSATTIESLKSKETKEKALSYGVNISGNPEQALENIARKMETMRTDAQKFEFASSMGIDEATTRLLIQGVERYREELKRTAKYQLYTKEDIERMRDYRQVQNDIRMGVQAIQNVISRLLLPVLTPLLKIMRSITDWVAQHEGAVKIVGMATAIFAGAMIVIGAIKAINLVLAVLMANPIVLWILGISAAIAVIIAYINDLIVFMQGGDSIIGDILKKMGVDTDALRANIQNFFKAVSDGVKAAIDWFKSLGDKIAELVGKIKDFWDGIPAPLKKLIGMSNPISGIYTAVTTAQEQITKANNNPVNAIPAGAVQNYNTTTAQNINRNNNAKNIATTNNNQRTTNIGHITVQTKASNGAEVANSIQKISQFDDGIAV